MNTHGNSVTLNPREEALAVRLAALVTQFIPSARDSTEQLLTEVRALRAEVQHFTALVAPLALRHRSREQQARKAGVHRSTLYRRERRAQARLALLLPTEIRL